MNTVGRRRFLSVLGVVVGAIAGCTGSAGQSTTPRSSDQQVETPAPEAEPEVPLTTPEVATSDVQTEIEPAPLVADDSLGFTFLRPTNWTDSAPGVDDGTRSFEYTAEDGRVLGNLRAWGGLNGAYDHVSDAESVTVKRLSEAGHTVLSTRMVTLPDGREGRIVEYQLAETPVRGATAVSLAGPWILRVAVLVHVDAHTPGVASMIEEILASVSFGGDSTEPA